METILHIQNITKDEFISIIENVIDNKISSIKKSDKPENYSVQTSAKLLGVSELTLYSYIKKGLLPASKIGRKYIIKSVDLENALKEYKSLRYRR